MKRFSIPYTQRNIAISLGVLAALIATPLLAFKAGVAIYGPNGPDVMGDKNKVVDTRPALADVKSYTRTVYVSNSGSDAADAGSATKPYKTISFALQRATPGTRVLVKAGTYNETIVSKRNGSSTKPIVLEAEGKVVIGGSSKSGRIVELRHDYHVINGFEFTGRDNQLWLQEADHNVITNNYFHHAQGECVRIKYHSSNNLIERNKIEHCGLEDYEGDGDGKNGEGVYIGTAPEQLSKNPTKETDKSNTNIVRNNTINTFANECVDIKEGSSFNIVEFNSCTGQRDKESGGLNSRGNSNIFRYNHVFNNVGAGIRLGGDEDDDGLNNEVYGNRIENNKFVALKVEREPQGQICGNIDKGNIPHQAEVQRALAADLALIECQSARRALSSQRGP